MKDKQTTQSPKGKIQKDKQRSTKHTHETKDRVTRTPLRTKGELRCYGRVNSSSSRNITSLLEELYQSIMMVKYNIKINIGIAP